MVGPEGGISTRSGVASVERPAFGLPGVPIFLLWLALVALAVWLLVAGQFLLSVVLGALLFFAVIGFFIVQPNQAKVLTLFGRYVGTERRNGMYWTNP